MKNAFWLSFLLTTLVLVAGCGSDEPPQFRLSNAAANVGDVQIKSSNGYTINISGSPPLLTITSP
jgi:predicted small lipoprotein YifL